MTDEMIPPHNEQAEQAVIGSVLKSPSVMAELSGVLLAEDFYTPVYRSLYAAGLRLWDRGEDVDYLSLSHESGVSLVELSAVDVAIPSSTHVLNYAKMVRDAATQRRYIDAAQQVAEMAWVQGVPVADLTLRADALMQRARGNHATGFVHVAKDLAERFMDILAGRDGDTLPGISTGIQKIDVMTMGLAPGRLYLIPARPGMGKSTLAQQIALHVARSKPVLLASLEMSAEELTERGIAMLSKVNGERLAYGKLSEFEAKSVNKAANDFARLKLTITDEDHTASSIRAKALRLQAAEGQLGLIVVDYGQLLQDKGSTGSSRDENQGVAAGLLKSLSLELKVPVLVPVQLNREVEKRQSDKRPGLADVRDSGNWEQAADVVMALYRDDYYDTEQKPGEAQVIMLKKRYSGGSKIGDAKRLVWIGDQYADPGFADGWSMAA